MGCDRAHDARSSNLHTPPAVCTPRARAVPTGSEMECSVIKPSHGITLLVGMGHLSRRGTAVRVTSDVGSRSSVK